jgi:hypothetical protein
VEILRDFWSPPSWPTIIHPLSTIPNTGT